MERGVRRIDGKDFIGKEKDAPAGGGGKNHAPAEPRFPVLLPVGAASPAHGLPRRHHACLAETHDEIIVNIADIHADTVHRKGHRAKSGGHAGKEHHADAFASLLTQDAAEKGSHLFEIGHIRNPLSPVEEALPPEEEIGIEERKEGACGGADGGAQNPIGRDGPQTTDEKKTQRCVQKISADIGLHNGSRIPIAQLHRLQDEGEGCEIHRQKRQRAVLHGLRQIIRRRPHENEYILEEKIEQSVKQAQCQGSQKEGFFQKIRRRLLLSPARIITGHQRHRRRQGTGKTKEDKPGLEENAYRSHRKTPQSPHQDEIRGSQENHKKPLQCGRQCNFQVMSVVAVHMVPYDTSCSLK